MKQRFKLVYTWNILVVSLSRKLHGQKACGFGVGFGLLQAGRIVEGTPFEWEAWPGATT